MSRETQHRANSSAAGQLFAALTNNSIHILIASDISPQIEQTKRELDTHVPIGHGSGTFPTPPPCHAPPPGSKVESN